MERIEIGTSGRYTIGSDTYPVTVVKVSKTGKTVYVQYDSFVVDKENGHDYYGQQKWIITRNENGRIERFDWSEKRKKYSQGGCGTLRLNGWGARQDPGF